MTSSRRTSPRELRRGGAGPGGQVRRQRSLRGEAGTLPRSALLSLLGVLQIPSRWGQGRQFYCRRLYEPELRLGGESGTQNLGAAQDGASPRVHWAASGSAEQPCGPAWRAVPPVSLRTSPPCRNTAAGTSTSSRPTADPGWGVGAQEEGNARLGPSAGGGSEAGGPDREPRWGPGSCGAERGGRLDRHSPAGHELGIRAPDILDTLQHRRHPRPRQDSPKTLCVAASRVEPGSHVAAVRAGGAD